MPAGARPRSSGRGWTTTITTTASAQGDVQGEMLDRPSLANAPAVRILALAATVALAAWSTSFLSTAALGFVHMLIFGSWFGTLAWTSFVFGIVAFRNLPRQTFGRLQSKLFPKYFALSSIAPTLLLATLNALTGGSPPQKEMILLAISAVASLVNLIVAEPAATKIMFERYELENAKDTPRDENAIKSLAKRFGKLHGISSLLNLVVLVCAVGHAYYLGARLVAI